MCLSFSLFLLITYLCTVGCLLTYIVHRDYKSEGIIIISSHRHLGPTCQALRFSRTWGMAMADQKLSLLPHYVTIISTDALCVAVEAGGFRRAHQRQLRRRRGRRLARARECHLLRGAGLPAHQGEEGLYDPDQEHVHLAGFLTRSGAAGEVRQQLVDRAAGEGGL